MTAQLILFPELPASQDIPGALRELANSIEEGKFGDAHNLAWVIDQGQSDIAIGLLGKAISPGAEAHLLFAIAQQKIVLGCM